MAAPSCPVRTAAPRSFAEECSDAVPELRAYKLGHRRWSYNLVELQLREGGDGGAAGRTATAVHAAASGARFPPPHQDSAVGFLLQLDSGAKVQAHVYLCYADAQPCSTAGGGGGGGGGEEEELFGWRLVTRQHCCKGCKGPVLRSIQRFGRVGSRQAKQSAALQQPASGIATAASAEPGGSPGGKQRSHKDPRFMYLSLDEACTHVNARAFRLVAGIYNRQGSRLLGTAVSPPIRVLSNNDAPTGAARIVLEATLPSDWEGWSGGSGGGGGLSSKRSAAAQPAQRQQKRLHSALKGQSAEQRGAFSMPSMALEPTQGMLANSRTLPAHAPASPAEQGGQQLQGPASPVPQAFARQLSLPPHPPSPLLLASGSCPPSPADVVQAGGLWEAVPPATLAAHLAPSLPLYSCSQAAAQHEAERQIALLQQLKASMAAAGSTAASSCSSPYGDPAGGGGSSGAGWAAAAALQPLCLPGIRLNPAAPGLPACQAIPGFPITLSPSGSLATATSALPPACAVALDRSGSSGGGCDGGSGSGAYCSPAGAGCGRLSPPLPAALEPGLGLGLGREYSLDDELDLLQLHGGMDDFGCCGLDDRGMPSLFDDTDALAFAF